MCRSYIASHLIFHRGHISLFPPVQLVWDLQEVGLHKERALEPPLSFVFVAIHHLPELLVSLWKNVVFKHCFNPSKCKRLNDFFQLSPCLQSGSFRVCKCVCPWSARGCAAGSFSSSSPKPYASTPPLSALKEITKFTVLLVYLLVRISSKR